MTSGISVSQKVLDKFGEVKSGKKIRYCFLFPNSDQTEITTDEGEPKPDNVDLSLDGAKDEWNRFCSKLPTETCRYAIYDMNYQRPGGARRDKLLLIVWCPESALPRDKMIFSSTLQTLKTSLTGIQVEIQSNGLDDLNFEEILQKVDKC